MRRIIIKPCVFNGKKNAFSLMEMMVVLLIVAIIAAATAPMITKKLARNAGSVSNAIEYFGLSNNYGNTSERSSFVVGGNNPHNNKVFINSRDANQPQLGFGINNNVRGILHFNSDSGLRLGDIGNTARNRAVAIGSLANSEGNSSIAMGNSAQALEGNTVAIGHSTSARAENAIAIGNNSSTAVNSTGAIAILGNVNGIDSVAIHGNAVGQNSVALSGNANAQNSVAIRGNTRAQSSVAILGNTTNEGSTAVGFGADATQNWATALGVSCDAEGQGSTAVGSGALARGQGSIAIGNGDSRTEETRVRATATNAIAIGAGAAATAENSVAIGAGVNNSRSGVIQLGGKGHTVYIPGNLIVGGNTIVGVNDGAFLFNWYNDDRLVAIKNSTTGGTEALDECTQGLSTNLYSTLYNIAFRDFNKLIIRFSHEAFLDWRGFHTSDRRLKNVGEKFTGGLAELKKLDLYNFTFKKDTEKIPQVGVMAQDLRKIFPNAVWESPDGYLRIRWDDMFFAVINAVRELDKKIETAFEQIKSNTDKVTKLQNKVDEQQKVIADLEKRLAKLEAKK